MHHIPENLKKYIIAQQTKTLREKFDLVKDEGHKLSAKHKKEILGRYENKCVICGSKKGDRVKIGGLKTFTLQCWLKKRVDIVFHAISKEFVPMCERCHFYYHFEQYLSAKTIKEWISISANRR